MSKELEAFERVWEDCSQLDLDYVSKHNLMDDLREIKKALTPPTQEEVCEALSEWFGDDFYYDVNQKEFYTKALNGQHSVVKLKNNEIHFGGWFTMPPHLITMIGRFYEGKERK